MNNEKYNQIIDEVYNSYADSHFIPPKNTNGKLLLDQLFSVIPMKHSKETFINECRNNPRFSKKWGLKIEEYQSLEQVDQTNPVLVESTSLYPKKVIRVTYKNEIIEFYE
jgi:hypothetical protein